MKSVEAGAAFLDEHKPGWDKLINLDTLDLSSACNCVVGQIYGREHPHGHKDLRFEKGLDELGLGGSPDAPLGRLGFLEWGNTSYRNLTAAWRKLIAARRAV